MKRKQMQIGAIYLDKNSGKPLVVLHDPDGKLIMPIWVGMPEVRAISMAAQDSSVREAGAEDGAGNESEGETVNQGEIARKDTLPPRPSVYELFLSVLSTAGVRVKEVSLEANKEQVFTAWVSLEAAFEPSEEALERLEARPADAVVLASISGAPLFVSSDLFDSAEVESQKPISDEETQQFKAFLEELKPSDFAKYSRDKDE